MAKSYEQICEEWGKIPPRAVDEGRRGADQGNRARSVYEGVHSDRRKEGGGSSVAALSDLDSQYSFSDETDAEGNQLTVGQAAYFKDSKVRDGDGNLLMVYHASEGAFNVFDRERIGSGSGNIYGRGFYFTYRKDVASDYGIPRAFYLKMKNPYVFDGFENGDGFAIAERWLTTLEHHGIEYNNRNRVERYYFDNEEVDESDLIDSTVGLKNVADVLQKAGYDGIVVSNAGEFVAFEPNQIKRINNLNPKEFDPNLYP